MRAEPTAASKREANEMMREALARNAGPDPIAFFCECPDLSCYQPVWLSVGAYQRARANPDWVAIAGDCHRLSEGPRETPS